MLLDKQGMLQPYAPRNLARVRSTMRDPAATPTWVGMDLWSSAVCFNTVEGGKRKLPTPASWADLTRPEFKGTITMPHPASSGTGYLMVAAWLQMMGEDKGWAYMDALDRNVATYTHSGSKPCTLAAAGEYPIGISFEFRAARMIDKGAPIAAVIPSEGIGWDMEASGILRGTANEADAKALIDWAVSDDAMKIYAENYAILANPALEKQVPNLPADIKAKLIKNDFSWAASNRAQILEEWQKRFDAKSEPKKS